MSTRAMGKVDFHLHSYASTLTIIYASTRLTVHDAAFRRAVLTSLAPLRRLPLAGVKLDAVLSQAGARSGAEARWLPALVQLAHAMGLEVHATGADTEAQCTALIDAGCDGLQGRRLGPWMEERALESWFSLPASRRRL